MKLYYVVVCALVLGSSSPGLANRMDNLEYMRHCGGMSPAECNETLESAKGVCITEEEYRTGKEKNRVPWCLNGKKFLSWCSCSCFSSSTRLLMRANEYSNASLEQFAQDPDKMGAYQFATLREGSLANIAFDWLSVGMWSSGSEEKPLVVIHTEDGKSLAVTGGHAILLSTGQMVFAESLSVGQKLVTQEGISVEITRLESLVTDQDVFNVLTNGDSLFSHLIIAEGLVVGDLAWENSLYSEMGRILVRQ